MNAKDVRSFAAKWLVEVTLVGLLSGCGGAGSSTGTNPGTLPVGRVDLTVTDESRTETFGVLAGGKRKLGLTIWYPSANNSTAPGSMGPILPPELVEQIATATGVPASVILSFPTRSHNNSAIRSGKEAYPVVVMSHGNGGTSIESLSAAEMLVSRGYVVVGVSHTGNAQFSVIDGSLVPGDPAASVDGVLPTLTESSPFSDHVLYNQNIQALADVFVEDLRFVIDELQRLNSSDTRLKSRLDLSRIGVFGHSFGGSHSFGALTRDSRVDAAVGVDGTIWNSTFKTGTTKPYMIFVGQRASAEDLAQQRQIWTNAGLTSSQIDQLFEWANSDQEAWKATPGAIRVQMPQAFHQNFTDIGVWESLGYPGKSTNPAVDPKTLLATYHRYLAAFFDEKLKGRYQPILHRTSDDPNAVVTTSSAP